MKTNQYLIKILEILGIDAKIYYLGQPIDIQEVGNLQNLAIFIMGLTYMKKII